MKNYRVSIMNCKGVLKYIYVLAANEIEASREGKASYEAYNRKPCLVWEVKQI